MVINKHMQLITSQIGLRIKQRRLLLQLTLKQLAEKIGCDEATIRKYESGEIHISAAKLAMISNALSVTIDYFIVEDSLIQTHHQQSEQLKYHYMQLRSPKHKKLIMATIQTMIASQR